MYSQEDETLIERFRGKGNIQIYIQPNPRSGRKMFEWNEQGQKNEKRGKRETDAVQGTKAISSLQFMEKKSET
jgi:hypothetical protein